MAGPPEHFHQGDEVIHTRRPEWGRGVVDQATVITHEGQPAQRLTIKFQHRGRVTVNTAIATLVSADAAAQGAEADNPSRLAALADSDPLDSQAQPDRRERLQSLESLSLAMTDPFASLGERLRVTLDSYRFSANPPTSRQPRDPRRLLEWAIAQTHLTDPLTSFTRHELEEAFDRFSYDRDRHLAQLIARIKKEDRHDLLEQAMHRCSDDAARSALKWALR